MKLTTTLPSSQTPGTDLARRSTGLIKQTPREKVLICVDHSGSMNEPFGRAGRRLDAAKQAIQTIVQNSSRAVTDLGLAAFESDTTLLCTPSTNFTSVTAYARTLDVAGGTAFRPVFATAFTEMPQRVILLSDGQPQESHEMLFACADQARELGIRFDCVGIGEADASLLKGIAERTNGIYVRCENVEQLVQTFRQLETRARALLEAK